MTKKEYIEKAIEEFEKEFDTSVIDEPMLKIALDGLLLRVKAFLQESLSKQREEIRGIVEKRKTPELSEDNIENELRIFTELPHNDENMRIFIKKLGEIVSPMAKNKEREDILKAIN